MKEYYIDNWNSMVIPNEREDLEKIVSDFYKSDVEFKYAGRKLRMLNIEDSFAFNRRDICKISSDDFDKLEYPLMENVYAYIVPNGTTHVQYTFTENDSYTKKLYIPSTVNWFYINYSMSGSKKITDNVWVEVVPENPYFYSENGSVYKKDTNELVYFYQKSIAPSKTGRVKVRNLNGTSDNSCKCDEYDVRSWLYHWTNFNPAQSYLPENCPCCHKKISDWSDEMVGAHVQKENDSHWYVIPLCKKCNSKSSDESFEVEDIGFAWANTSETCLKYKNRHQFIKDYLSLNKK